MSAFSCLSHISSPLRSHIDLKFRIGVGRQVFLYKHKGLVPREQLNMASCCKKETGREQELNWSLVLLLLTQWLGSGGPEA